MIMSVETRTLQQVHGAALWPLWLGASDPMRTGFGVHRNGRAYARRVLDSYGVRGQRARYQSAQTFVGCIGVPTRHWNASANGGNWLRIPFTR